MLVSMIASLVLCQVPAPNAPGRPAVAAAPGRQAELQRLNEQRRTRRAQATASRNRAFGLSRRPAAQPAMADPVAMQATNAQIQALSQQNMALQGIADAAQRRAGAAEAQYRLNSQVAGAPQVFVPGQGMVPYPYGIAPAAATYPQIVLGPGVVTGR